MRRYIFIALAIAVVIIAICQYLFATQTDDSIPGIMNINNKTDSQKKDYNILDTYAGVWKMGHGYMLITEKMFIAYDRIINNPRFSLKDDIFHVEGGYKEGDDYLIKIDDNDLNTAYTGTLYPSNPWYRVDRNKKSKYELSSFKGTWICTLSYKNTIERESSSLTIDEDFIEYNGKYLSTDIDTLGNGHYIISPHDNKEKFIITLSKDGNELYFFEFQEKKGIHWHSIFRREGARIHDELQNIDNMFHLDRSLDHYNFIFGERASNIDDLKMILKDEYDVNRRGCIGSGIDDDTTPLMRAIARGDIEIAKYLVASGASFKAIADYRTIMHFALMNHIKNNDTTSEDIISWLLQNRVEFNYSAMAFYLMNNKFSPSALDWLEKKNVDFTIIPPSGTTLLHLAILSNAPTAVKFILKKGLDPDLYSEELKKTAMRLAVEQENREIINLMKEYRDKRNSKK